MANPGLLFSTVIVLSFISFSSLFVIEAAGNGGFSVDLIHRDSPLSPLHNRSRTLQEQMHHALRRSLTRFNRLTQKAASSKTAQTSLIPDNGEYLLKFSIGNPPHEVFGIFDTGSDLIWTQCLPCDNCYKQIHPIFDPKKSSTYKDVPCESDTCKLVSGFCDGSNKLCSYYTGYGDSSFSKGLLGTETITLSSTTGESIAFPNIMFGCGHNNTGTFDERGSGIIGLGSGTVSLASQLASPVGGTFSYCLTPVAANKTTTLNFGSKASSFGPATISTPMYLRDSFYHLTLEAISVGNKRVPYASSPKVSSKQEGNIIIDTGTPMMMLPRKFYQDFEAAIKEATHLQPLQNPPAYKLCYRTSNDNDLPTATVHFKGADLKIKPLNMFVRIGTDVLCFAIVPVDGLAVFGNTAHINFLVSYDVVNNVISFKEADCTTQQF